MKKAEVLAALGALSQETRLDIYRLLVQAGEDGLAAGKIGEELGLPSATLAFHLKERFKSFRGAQPPRKLRWTNAGVVGLVRRYGDFAQRGLHRV